MHSGKGYQRLDDQPTYDYPLNPRLYNRRVKQFQCCSCILILCAVSILLILMVEYAIENEDVGNDTVPFTSSPTETHLLLKSGAVPAGLDHTVSAEEVEAALQWSLAQLKMKNILDTENAQVPIGSPMHKHQQATANYKPTLELARKGFIISKASQHLFSKHPNLTLQNSIKVPQDSPSFEVEYCETDENASCEQKHYRTIDGSCNNLLHPKLWGVAMRPFRRMLQPEYCDGVYLPRCGKNGADLPSARLVTIKFHRPEYQNDPRFNVMFAVWGQFIDHDISATALSRGTNGEFLSCCDLKPENMHPECFPVNISKDDPYYSQQNVTCMDFVRSAAAPTCTFGAREQLNQVSSYLDGSAVYGNTEELANNLRSFQLGQLKMYHTKDNRELLPVSKDPNDGCNQADEIKRGRYCFLSGDGRANENLHLTTMHLILARQHNFVANNLKKVNPQWDDERLYQESRKIVSAQIQHITYNEFLEPLLGPDVMAEYDLRSYTNGYYRNYNDSVDSTMSNVFAAAAFRFAHTLLPGLIRNTDKSIGSSDYTELHNILFNPFSLYKSGNLDSVLEGAMGTKVEKSNRFFSKEVTEHLFEKEISTGEVQPNEKKNKTCGLDLVSLNLQRGRDHGLPGYVYWRKLCNLHPIDSFESLNSVIDPESIKVLSNLYRNIEDIDLYSGALAEFPVKGGMLGPTVTCIIADQFRRLKVGDRYWYENHQQPHSFTIDQLEEIRKTTLSKIICDNADNLTNVPREIMKIGNFENKHINCNELSEIRFSLWAERSEDIINKGKQILDGTILKSGFKSVISPNTTETYDGADYLKISNNENISSTSLMQAAPTSIVRSKKNPTKDVIKSYFSATITGGNISAIRNGEYVNFFNGQLPATFHLDEIIDPNSWGTSAKVKWSGHVEGNSTIIGKFNIPLFVNEESSIENQFLQGQFNLDFVYKWGGNADIIVPNKEFDCKIMFFGSKKSTVVEVNPALLETTISEEETCTIMISGTFYQRSFMCIFFPWWCSNEKLFYWSGDIELKLRKSIVPKEQPLLRNSWNLNNVITNDHIKIKNILMGRISDGWVKFSEKYYISLPLTVQLPLNTIMYEQPNARVNIFGREITWSCDFFHNSVYGTFSLPLYSQGEVVSRHKGRFYFNIDKQSNLPLYKIIIPGMQYSTFVHLHDQHTNEFITNVSVSSRGGLNPAETWSIVGNIILVGNHSRNSNTFDWDGKFIMILIGVPPVFHSYF